MRGARAQRRNAIRSGGGTRLRGGGPAQATDSWTGQDLASPLRDAGSILGHDTLALIDNLTLLYTRRYFHESAHAEAQRAEARGHTFSVVLIELTGIAELNWREGYAAGDEAIRIAARTVQYVASRHGGTACHQGGHRLGLILSDTDERSAGLLADELLVSLRDGPSASQPLLGVPATTAKP